MVQLIKSLFLFFIFFGIFSEIFLRLTGLASDVPILHIDENNYLLYEANQAGHFTRGYRAEVSTNYKINSQGWNSIIEYDQVDSNTIALIGDSYIEGFYVDTDASIGRKIEQLTNHRFSVHEYGIAGANIHDYATIYSDLRKKGYQNIFVNIGTKDIMASTPSFTNKNKYNGNTILREIYTNVALMRYLNVNLHFREFFTKKKSQSKKFNEEKLKIRFDSLAPLGAIYLYDDPVFEKINTKFDMIPIVVTHQPYNYGFNSHWNENGALNVAETITKRLLTKTGFPSTSSN